MRIHVGRLICLLCYISKKLLSHGTSPLLDKQTLEQGDDCTEVSSFTHINQMNWFYSALKRHRRHTSPKWL
jgi:hypothetical protein